MSENNEEKRNDDGDGDAELYSDGSFLSEKSSTTNATSAALSDEATDDKKENDGREQGDSEKKESPQEAVSEGGKDDVEDDNTSTSLDGVDGTDSAQSSPMSQNSNKGNTGTHAQEEDIEDSENRDEDEQPDGNEAEDKQHNGNEAEDGNLAKSDSAAEEANDKEETVAKVPHGDEDGDATKTMSEAEDTEEQTNSNKNKEVEIQQEPVQQNEQKEDIQVPVDVQENTDNKDEDEQKQLDTQDNQVPDQSSAVQAKANVEQADPMEGQTQPPPDESNETPKPEDDQTADAADDEYDADDFNSESSSAELDELKGNESGGKSNTPSPAPKEDTLPSENTHHADGEAPEDKSLAGAERERRRSATPKSSLVSKQSDSVLSDKPVDENGITDNKTDSISDNDKSDQKDTTKGHNEDEDVDIDALIAETKATENTQNENDENNNTERRNKRKNAILAKANKRIQQKPKEEQPVAQKTQPKPMIPRQKVQPTEPAFKPIPTKPKFPYESKKKSQENKQQASVATKSTAAPMYKVPVGVPVDFRFDGDDRDLVLKCGEDTFYCHCAVLSMWSMYCRDAIRQNKNGKRIEIDLENIPGTGVDELLHVIYPPNTMSEDADMEVLLDISDRLQVREVTKRCEEQLMSIKPTMSTLLLAAKYKLTHLQINCVQMLKTQPMETLTCGENAATWDALDQKMRNVLMLNRTRYLEGKILVEDKRTNRQNQVFDECLDTFMDIRRISYNVRPDNTSKVRLRIFDMCDDALYRLREFKPTHASEEVDGLTPRSHAGNGSVSGYRSDRERRELRMEQVEAIRRDRLEQRQKQARTKRIKKQQQEAKQVWLNQRLKERPEWQD